MTQNTKVWLKGLTAAISGGLYSGFGSIAVDSATSHDADISRALWLAAFGAISHTLAYLKESPWPKDETDV